MVKTIKLSGSEIKVTGLGGDNTEIFNNSSETIYASKLPEITAGGDDVIAIPAGAIDGLYGTRGTVYLLGSGNVELRGVDHKITKARGSSGSGSVAGVSQGYVDENDKKTLAAAKAYTDSVNAELAGFVGYTDSDIYGFEADFENCIFTRLAGAVGKTAGADFDKIRAYGGRRRCNLSDGGEVLAYYGDDNFKSDGSNGQVMVEQPKFYYRVVPLKTEKIDDADGYHLRKARYYISDMPKAGFKVHPAFVCNGVEVDKIYLSAFEGSIYDMSAGAYLLDDEQIADFDNDKLSSIANAKPCSGQSQALTRANTRKLAHNRGRGWAQSYMATVAATELLMAIEYASFNTQETFGSGNTTQAQNFSNIKKTGRTVSCGNATSTVIGNDNIQFITYRGEENFYGNCWTWVDGGNVFFDVPTNSCGKLYVTDHGFTDDISDAPYRDTGLLPCPANGYVSAFGYSKDFDWLFIAAECKGNSALPIGDYFWFRRENWVNTLFGGGCYDSLKAGAFYWSMYNLSSSKRWDAGGRLVYIPGKTS